MRGTRRRLSRVYNESETIPFDKSSKFVIMSDCHRGQASTGDNFLPNKVLHRAALEHYYKNGFVYIELGDGDELWENRKIQPIISANSDIFKLMSKFYEKNRMYMLYGNHDIVKKRSRSGKCFYYSDGGECKFFPRMNIAEGLILENQDSGRQIFLVHGHQGSFLNDTLWPVARFLVRYVWRPLETIGFTAPIAPAEPKKKDAIEKKLSAFANSQNLMLITGHTHRISFPDVGKSLYFNDGCCVHPYRITGIEIENGKIALVKWSVSVKEDRVLYVDKEVLEGPEDIEKFYAIKKPDTI